MRHILQCVLSVFQCGESSIVSPVQGLQFAFLTAAYEGDLDKIKDLIGQGCSVNAKTQVKLHLHKFNHGQAHIACFSSTCGI